jgi:hypothetical protein
MARNRDEREYQYADAERDRRHRRRRHRDDADEQAAAKQERREHRRADEARREAELDIEDLRARRESYYTRQATERMAQETRPERKKEVLPGAQREPRRDGTRRAKKRDAAADERSDEYVYGRPKSRGVVEEVRRSSARKRSDEGGSSSRTAYTPLSGSASASGGRAEATRLSR